MGVPHHGIHPHLGSDLGVPHHGYPHLGLGYPGRDLEPVTGVPPQKDMGPVEVLWDGDGVSPQMEMGPVEVLWDGDGATPLPPPPPPPRRVNRQTPVKT